MPLLPGPTEPNLTLFERIAMTTLREFSQINHFEPSVPTQPPPRRWPVKIIWPAEAKIAVVGGQWRRLKSGQIEATYHTLQELELGITVSAWLKEWSGAPAVDQMEQSALF
jgi:hypothetical protein